MSPAGAWAGLVLAAAAAASAQVEPVDEPGAYDWSFAASAYAYLLPDDEDYLLPIVTARRGALHLEGRYNYEDQETASLFAGRAFGLGAEPAVELTPLLGVVYGNTVAWGPALEIDASYGPVAWYGEAEYVFDLEDHDNDFFYMWAELSAWPVEWLRGGIVTQRTRAYESERDVQRGLLVGVARSGVEGTLFVLNPGAGDHFVILSMAVDF